MSQTCFLWLATKLFTARSLISCDRKEKKNDATNIFCCEFNKSYTFTLRRASENPAMEINLDLLVFFAKIEGEG